MLAAFLVIPAMGFINKVRGGGIWPKIGLIHNRYWATLMTLLPAGLLGSFGAAILWTLCWMIWTIPPWGRWFTLGRYTRHELEIRTGRNASVFERLIEATGGNDHTCFWLRHMVAIVPMALFFGMAAFALPLAILLAYMAGWIYVEDTGEFDRATQSGKWGNGPGEWLTGFAFGTYLVFLILNGAEPWSLVSFLQSFSWWR